MPNEEIIRTAEPSDHLTYLSRHLTIQETKISDMTQEYAKACEIRATADMEIAKSTHVVPAKQRTIQIFMFIVGPVVVLLATLAAAVFRISDEKLISILIYITMATCGIFGIPALVYSFRVKKN